MHQCGFAAFHKKWRPAVPLQQLLDFFVRYACEHRRIGDLVAVQMKDRQHRTVAHRIKELVGMPGGRERARFRFAIADHARGNQVRVVEYGAEGMAQRVTKLAALVNRSRAFRRSMTGNAAGK